MDLAEAIGTLIRGVGLAIPWFYCRSGPDCHQKQRILIAVRMKKMFDFLGPDAGMVVAIYFMAIIDFLMWPGVILLRFLGVE